MIHDLLILPFLESSFMHKALAGCLITAAGSTSMGVFLMLRRMSLAGEVVSHAILPGIAISYFLVGFSSGIMILGGFIAGTAVILFASLITRLTPLREDASLAALHLVSVAAGVVIISANSSSEHDLLHILFGSLTAINDNILFLIAGIATLSLISLAVLYRPLVIECVDPTFLRCVSPLGVAAHYVFLMLVILNLVSGFHALGTLMTVGLMILPPVAARFWARQLINLFISSWIIASLGSFLGLLLSYHSHFPPGPAIILSIGMIYFLSLLTGPIGGLLPRYLPWRSFEA